MLYDPRLLMSWGVVKLIPTLFNDMPAMRFRVNGFIFRGTVVVAYNGGADLYEVFLLGPKNVIVKHLDGIYFDELTEKIDRLVEKDCSDEEYGKKVKIWMTDQDSEAAQTAAFFMRHTGENLLDL